jgi:hypothetical protein
MQFEETDTEDSGNSLNDDFAKVQFQSSSSKEEVSDDDLDLQGKL